MKYFTKEYIRECDCEEIQKLKEQLDYYDIVVIKGKIKGYKKGIYRISSKAERKYLCYSRWDTITGIYDRTRIIYLPTGDQLNEEIIKICDKKRWLYKFTYHEWQKKIYTATSYRLDDEGYISIENLNPYLAKIKLLKQLFKESK